MSIFENNKKDSCEKNDTENLLRGRVGELEVESMHKSEAIDRLEKELSEAKATIDKLEKLRDCQSRIIDIYKSMDDKESVVIDGKLEEYITRQRRIFNNKVKHGFNTTNIYQEARYILEEVAELMRAIEKNDRENMIEELADIVIFSYGCAEVARLGNLDKEIFKKMAINENREYHQTLEGDFVKNTDTHITIDADQYKK